MATSTIPKSLASEVNAVETSLATKTTEKSNSWGTTLSWTVKDALSLLIVNRRILVTVWTPSTTDISLLVITPSGNFEKNGSNGVVKFGTSSTNEDYTLTRNGSEVTFTTSGNTSIKVLT